MNRKYIISRLQFYRSGQDHEVVCSPEKSPMIIGRSLDAHIILTSHRVSRLHCQVYRKYLFDDLYGWYIIDLNSKNGTWINGRRLFSSHFLMIIGDLINIGGTRMLPI